MLINELYEYYGSWAKLSRALEMGSGTYWTWKKRGYIPFPTQLMIEYKTKGRFKASEEHGEPIDSI